MSFTKLQHCCNIPLAPRFRIAPGCPRSAAGFYPAEHYSIDKSCILMYFILYSNYTGTYLSDGIGQRETVYKGDDENNGYEGK